MSAPAWWAAHLVSSAQSQVCGFGIVDVDLGAEDVLVTDLRQRLVEHVLHRTGAAGVVRDRPPWPMREPAAGAAAAVGADRRRLHR